MEIMRLLISSYSSNFFVPCSDKAFHKNVLLPYISARYWPIVITLLVLAFPPVGHAHGYPPGTFFNHYQYSFGYNKSAAFAACEADEAHWASHCNPGWRGGVGCTTGASEPCADYGMQNQVGRYCPNNDMLYGTGFWYYYDNSRYNHYAYFWCESETPPPPPPDKDLGPKCPSAGNPCSPATGNKYESVSDTRGGDGVPTLTRHYNSYYFKNSGLGLGWTAGALPQLELAGDTIIVRRGNGRGEPFGKDAQSGLWVGDSDTTFHLGETFAGGYTLTNDNGEVEQYNSAGQLTSITKRDGQTTTYVYYANGKLEQIVGPFGHRLNYGYEPNLGKTNVTDSAGHVVSYTVDEFSNLVQVDFPDDTATRYLYGSALAETRRLTGISYVDIDGIERRYSTYGYDPYTGKAVLTEHARTNEPNIGQGRFTLSYDSDTQTTVTGAAGTVEVMTFNTNLGVKNLVGKVNQSDGKTLTQKFDANNNLICKKDDEGRVTTYEYNATNQKTSMTEGQGGDCSNPPATATAIPGVTRITGYEYLGSNLDLPRFIRRPSVASGQTFATEIQYNDNIHPLLPTNVIQRGYRPDGTLVSRTVALGYNGSGQVNLINGPRTNVNDITMLDYYECTTGKECGQLKSITSALGHITTFDRYDDAGRLLQMTDSNGLMTTYTYDPRGRVRFITLNGNETATTRITEYRYNAAGNVRFVGFPDGRTLDYRYNDAQELKRITDNLGNYIWYGYDTRGNRNAEYTSDADGTLVRQIDRAFDARNHINWVNAAGRFTDQLFDAVGNLVNEIVPNDVGKINAPSTTHQYDVLNRLFKTIDRINGETDYGYDANDRVKSVKAPNNVNTTYEYDDLGNLLKEVSPDRGTITYTPDDAGNAKTVRDARGITTTYTYDALNRVTQIDYPGTAEDVTLIYDAAPGCNNGVGRLCQVTDESGTTVYSYNPFGDVRTQTVTTLGHSYTTSYTPDLMGRTLSVTYPGGRQVDYTRDALGRISAIASSINYASGAIAYRQIASNITYQADGLRKGMTFDNGLSETRLYNPKGDLRYQFLGSADTRVYTYDLNGNLWTLQSLGGNGSYTYDNLDRLDTVAWGNNGWDYDHDGNGNRTGPGSYFYESNTNRLTGVGAPNTVNLDAAGNTLSDAQGRSYTYDNAGRLRTVDRSLGSGVYVYNYLGQRTRKTTNSPGDSTVYHYDTAGHLIAESRPNGTMLRHFLWVDETVVAQIDIDPPTGADTVTYLHTDYLGTPRLATNAAQQVVWRWEGEAFGDSQATGSVTINLRFPGQYYDAESGLHYNWHRYYDPKIGRYITSDPAGVFVSLNTYAYVGNNPLVWSDPLGLKAERGDNSIYPPSMNCSCTLNCQSCRGGKSPICDVLPFRNPKIGNVEIPIIGTLCKEVEGGFSCARQCTEFCSGRSKISPYPEPCEKRSCSAKDENAT